MQNRKVRKDSSILYIFHWFKYCERGVSAWGATFHPVAPCLRAGVLCTLSWQLSLWSISMLLINSCWNTLIEPWWLWEQSGLTHSLNLLPLYPNNHHCIPYPEHNHHPKIISGNNLMNKLPILNAARMLILLSLPGLPPLTGFLPQWPIIQELAKQEITTAALIIALLSLLGLFLYLCYSAVTLPPNSTNHIRQWYTTNTP